MEMMQMKAYISVNESSRSQIQLYIFHGFDSFTNMYI